ncbi:hypothetical protein Y843_04820 [Listeria monocytogenes]|nr:hypothetical protein [Listeria monocytogenes]
MSSIVWEKILQEVEKALNDRPLYINQPAKNNDIIFLEQALNCPIPDAFKEYLLTFNGQTNWNTQQSTPLLGFNYFLSSHNIIETWSTMNVLFTEEEPIKWVTENKIKPLVWSNKWIPFTDFEAQQKLILDLDPGKNGQFGQIFSYHSGMDYQEIVADSFEEFSRSILKKLQKNDYTIDNHIIQFNNYYI